MTKPIASAQRTNEILKKFDMYAKKSFGQNFIIEGGIVEKIARNCNCDDVAVIEIGPGIGALTEQLAKRAKKVVCYEIDERLKDVLDYSLAEYDNVEVIFEDFLSIDLLEKVNELNNHYQRVVICANLPYYITTPILFKIFESKANVDNITVMMQNEVADRFLAKVDTKDYNALSIIASVYYNCKSVMKVSRTIFNPRPNIDSTVIQFYKQENAIEIKDEQGLFLLIKGCFKQRRKTIYNNYREFLQDKDNATNDLEKANIALIARAETCTLDDFIKLKGVKDERESLCEN